MIIRINPHFSNNLKVKELSSVEIENNVKTAKVDFSRIRKVIPKAANRVQSVIKVKSFFGVSCIKREQVKNAIKRPKSRRQKTLYGAALNVFNCSLISITFDHIPHYSEVISKRIAVSK